LEHAFKNSLCNTAYTLKAKTAANNVLWCSTINMDGLRVKRRFTEKLSLKIFGLKEHVRPCNSEILFLFQKALEFKKLEIRA